MVDARRPVAALAALLGLGVAVVGGMSAVSLGAEGRATLSASAAGPVVIGPSVLNRVDGPVTVEASSSAGQVWLGAAVPEDARDAIGVARHDEVLAVQVVPGRTLELATAGDRDLADPRPLHVWRATGEGRLVIRQADAPESVVAYPTSGGPVLLSLTWRQPAWFLGSLAVLVGGVVLLACAGALWARARRTGRPGPAAGAHRGVADPDGRTTGGAAADAENDGRGG